MQEALFWQYAQIVQQNFGIQLTIEKKALLESRLFKLFNNKLEQSGFADDESFLAYVKEDASGTALKLLAEAITTHHTFFMREPEHFDFFGRQVLPYLERTVTDGDVRTWCAACSSGEEAYILEMQLMDFFEARGPQWDTMLLATDLSYDILDTAKAGIYTEEAVSSLPPQWRAEYFTRLADGSYQAAGRLRQKILYRRFNLMTPVFPFKKPFHVIFCRNVMIYFDAPTRDALVRKFCDFLEPGGFLFVGHSEVIDRQAAAFEYIMPSVYRKR